MFDEQALNDYAKTFLQKHFQITKQIPVVRNNRLRTTLGRYVYARSGKPLRIELSGNLLTFGTEEIIYSVLRHECIHYAFHLQGKKMHDGDPLFEQTLRQFDAPSTRTVKVGKYFLFSCQKCQQKGETNIKAIVSKPNKYRSSCCHGKLTVIGYKIYDGVQATFVANV